MARVNTFSTTGVWWDLDSCPVPPGVDPGIVRQRIKSALTSFFGARAVIVFAVGNLNNTDPDILEKIYSSGILLRHTSSGGSKVCELISIEWTRRVASAPIMLISSDPSWFLPNFTFLGCSILRAYDGPDPKYIHCMPLNKWGWESLLKAEYPSRKNLQAPEKLPALCCFLCLHQSQGFDYFIKHLNNPKHMEKENLLLCSVPSTKKVQQPRTGVWWDLDSCPVPYGVDPGCVHEIIESALTRYFGPHPVTVFAVGNLNNTDPDILEKISSSGILLRHTSSGGSKVYELIFVEWKSLVPSGSIMLISSDTSWFNSNFTSLGYSILRAYDGPHPKYSHCLASNIWVWATLLKDYYPSSDVTTNCQAPEKKLTAFLCYLCLHQSQGFDDFIKHLSCSEHMEDETFKRSVKPKTSQEKESSRENMPNKGMVVF